MGQGRTDPREALSAGGVLDERSRRPKQVRARVALQGFERAHAHPRRVAQGRSVAAAVRRPANQTREQDADPGGVLAPALAPTGRSTVRAAPLAICRRAARAAPQRSIPPAARRRNTMASLSRQLAQWVVGLRYEDLPPDVVDRAKGVTLQGLASVLLGSLTPGGRQAIKLISEEEAGVKHGATIMVDGARVTRGGAAFADAEKAMAGGKWDTSRMLTHPGTSIIPGAFVAAETAGASGRDFLTGLAARHDALERMGGAPLPHAV